MSKFENINFDELIQKANKEQCEIFISFEPSRTEITIQPWRPINYICPLGNKTQEQVEKR